MILKKILKLLILILKILSFQFDEIKRLFEELSIKLDTALINKIENIKTSENSSEEKLIIHEDEEETKNTLGTLKINSEDLSEEIAEE